MGNVKVRAPLSTAAIVASAIVAVWLVFALAFLPAAGNVPQALAASGAALTTLGLGDAPNGAGWHVLGVAEAACGMAMLTAAVSYVLSQFPLLTRIRSAALRFTDLGLDQPESCARVLDAAGPAPARELHEAIIDVHQRLRRFPTLSSAHAEAVGSLLRCATVTAEVLRSQEQTELATALDRALERVAPGRSPSGRADRPAATPAP